MKKGFTLLELLIVIGILAILAATTVVVLNPAELLKQSRDAQRVVDLGALHSALGLYVTSASSPNLGACNRRCTVAAVTPFGTDASPTGCTTTSNSTVVTGTGWVDVDFATGIPGGSPLAKLPIDPLQSASGYYGYGCDNTAKTYELVTVFESTKFATTDDLDGKDGGNRTAIYEIGTEPALDL